MNRNRRRCLTFCAALLGVGGCFTVEPDLITRERDAAVAEDAATSGDSGEEDADTDPMPDGAAIEAAEPLPPPCDVDGDCDEDQVCIYSGARCGPRCEEGVGCLQSSWPFEGKFNTSLITDDQRVYWGSSETTDAAGNPRGDETIWSWDLKRPPRAIAVGLCEFPVFVADGYLYCHLDANRAGFARVRSDGSGGAQTLDASDAVSAWTTREHVWWYHHGATPGLWRLTRTGNSVPEEVTFADRPSMIVIGTTDMLFHTIQGVAGGSLGMRSLIDPTKTQVIAGTECYPDQKYAVDEHAVYCTSFTGLKRVPFDGSGTTKYLHRAGEWGGNIQLVGDFVYWSAGGQTTFRIGRTDKFLRTDPELLVDRDGGGGPGPHLVEYAVVGDQLVYFSQRRLVVKPLPAPAQP